MSSPQQDSRHKAVHKEICLSHVSGISSYADGLTQAILDFIKVNSFRLIKPAN